MVRFNAKICLHHNPWSGLFLFCIKILLVYTSWWQCWHLVSSCNSRLCFLVTCTRTVSIHTQHGHNEFNGPFPYSLSSIWSAFQMLTVDSLYKWCRDVFAGVPYVCDCEEGYAVSPIHNEECLADVGSLATSFKLHKFTQNECSPHMKSCHKYCPNFNQLNSYLKDTHASSNSQLSITWWKALPAITRYVYILSPYLMITLHQFKPSQSASNATLGQL